MSVRVAARDWGVIKQPGSGGHTRGKSCGFNFFFAIGFAAPNGQAASARECSISRADRRHAPCHKEVRMGFLGPPNVERLEAKRDVSRLIQALNCKKDDKVRASAARALGRIGSTEAVEPLIASSRGDDETARAATRALGQIRDPRAIEPLVRMARGKMGCAPFGVGASERAMSLDRTLKSLALFGSDSVESLVALFAHSTREHDRGPVIDALASTGSDEAVQWLMMAYVNYPSERWRIVMALGKCGDQRAVNTLKSALFDSSARVRRLAATALDELGWEPEGAEPGAHYWVAKRAWSNAVDSGHFAVKPLIDVIFNDFVDRDADMVEREAAADALGRIGLAGLEPLIEAISSHRFVRDWPLKLWGREDALDYPDFRPEPWNYCVRVLVRMGDDAAEPLRALLSHDSRFVRGVCAEALQQIS